MSSRSGGAGNKKKNATSGNMGSGTANNRDGKGQQSSNSDSRMEDNGFTPLETRMIEIRDSSGSVKQVPALEKRWAPSMNYIEFYLPSCKTLLEDETSIFTWLDYMEMYSNDLKWLLSVPHHQFWSVMVYSPEVPQVVLQSFLLRAPQWYDKEFPVYLEHEIIGPKYQEIYSLAFRVFMRLCTYKESKQDFISPITWARLLTDHQIMDVLKLQILCCLYDSERNAILPKMIENLLKFCPSLTASFRSLIPVLLSKSEEMTDELKKRIRESSATNNWNLDEYEEILSFFLSTTCGLYKFAKVHTPVAEIVMRFPNVLMKLAATYEPNCCKVWSQVTSHLPSLEERVMLLGVFIDETRIDYIANAISSCFHACGEDYSVEKIVVDPLYDPNFDRQLLGACSLDVTGPELAALVTQVKDILAELPDPYVEVVLKHYGYQPEVAINALLECSVPSRLDKYKNESYVQPPANISEFSGILAKDTELEKLASKLVIKDADTDAVETVEFFPGKRSHGFDDKGQFYEEDDFSAIKPKIKDLVTNIDEEPAHKRFGGKPYGKQPLEDAKEEQYVDESLLPSFRHTLEYEDEYDDTYDELGVGMTEPDNTDYKPLNQKKMQAAADADDEDDEDDEPNKDGKKPLDLYEDPAIVRARMERRREDKMQHHNHHRRGPPSSNDVVGRAKGQGQDKDVLYARRQKNANKDPGGFKKKRADFKRREF